MSGKRSNVWLRSVLSPKMIALFLFLALATVVSIRLGYWQLERATSRGADRVHTEHSERLESPALPLTDVIGLQETMTAEEYAHPVYVTGTFMDDQLRVVGRSVDGRDADLILAGLTVSQGPATGGTVPVIRGWVRPGEPLPDVPNGQVTVFGYLAGPEDSVGGLTEDTAQSISAGELVNRWGSPILSGYLAQFGGPPNVEDGQSVEIPLEDRNPDGRFVPAPKPTEEGGFNLQNAAYAAEWVIFAGFFSFLYLKLLRADVRQRKDEELLADYDALTGTAPPSAAPAGNTESL